MCQEKIDELKTKKDIPDVRHISEEFNLPRLIPVTNGTVRIDSGKGEGSTYQINEDYERTYKINTCFEEILANINMSLGLLKDNPGINPILKKGVYRIANDVADIISIFNDKLFSADPDERAFYNNDDTMNRLNTVKESTAKVLASVKRAVKRLEK